MRPQRVQRSVSVDDGDEELARLEAENAQLRHAVSSHATVDQAIGVLVAVHKIAPVAGFVVLREVSQHTNLKLHTVAEAMIGWALSEPLPEPVGQALGAALQRSGRADGPWD